MKRLLPVILFAALVLAGCGIFDRKVSVQDVTRSETIILKKVPGQGAITGISLTGRGSITGKAEVQLILNGAVYKREEVSGGVSFKWDGDWYADEAEVRYLAGTASNGTLTLSYDFQAL